MDNIILKVENIRKSYGRHKVLKGAGFACRAGQCIGIAGVNGSGKSTLLSVIAGIQKPDEGTVTAYGVDLQKNKSYISRCIGYVPQENPLIEDLSVMDNLKLWYCDSPWDLKTELESGFLKKLGINEYQKKAVRKLSGGMKKRMSIAIAVHNKPGILLLDEPGASLDLLAKKIIRDYLKWYISTGGTVIIVTHDNEELDMCDALYVVSEGRLIETDKSLRGEELLKGN
ncbi:MAG: ABC transporter ATP-binding protein [Lachnospiraceae bacterium]